MVGKHVILDLYDVEPIKMININNDGTSIHEWNILLGKKFKEANVNCLNVNWHNFNNSGSFTCLYLLAESHLSIHTWPENKFIAIDIFTCGNSNIDILTEFMIKYFNPVKKELKILSRGNKTQIEEISNDKKHNIFDLTNMESFLYY